MTEIRTNTVLDLDLANLDHQAKNETFPRGPGFISEPKRLGTSWDRLLFLMIPCFYYLLSTQNYVRFHNEISASGCNDWLPADVMKPEEVGGRLTGQAGEGDWYRLPGHLSEHKKIICNQILFSQRKLTDRTESRCSQ